MTMNIPDQTIDRLEAILGETRHGFDFEQLIEATGNDDDSRIAGCIYRILFGDESQIIANKKEALLAFAAYFDIEAYELDDAKVVYDRDSHSDQLREERKAVA